MNMLMITVLVAGLVATGEREPDPDVSHRTRSGATDMVHVEGGTFEMGDIFADGATLASPVHTVTVSSFHLARREVTVEEFSSFVDETNHETTAETPGKRSRPGADESGPREDEEDSARLAGRGCWVLATPSDGDWVDEANWRNPQYEQGLKHPVTCVSWSDAVHYCNWLSKKEGLPAAYDVTSGALLNGQGQPTTDVTKVRGYRLATEAEWEFAARERGRKVRFGNGRNTARASEINFDARSDEYSYAEHGEYRGRTTPVGSFKPNSLGLHDMSGNVWEWCSDHVDRYPTDSETNPYQTRGDLDRRRAARGGPWVGDASVAQVTVRLGWVAEDRCNNIGFRVARSE